MMNTDSMLVKYKLAGMATPVIAGRLGLTPEQVEKRWLEIQQLAKLHQGGVAELMQQFTIMCNQYQLTGESLKIIARALGNTMPPAEIEQLIVEGDRAATLKNILERCIVLRPFVMEDPQANLEEHQKALQQGN